MSEPTSSCLNCKYIGSAPVPGKPGGQIICQRYPPTLVNMGMTEQGPATASMWPMVDPAQAWQKCGEFVLQLIKPVAGNLRLDVEGRPKERE